MEGTQSERAFEGGEASAGRTSDPYFTAAARARRPSGARTSRHCVRSRGALHCAAVPLALAFFLSGAAALMLQVLWTRMMGHVLGATALAVSTVLTVFMGGLALGSHLGGRWAPRFKQPILVFAALEAGVGLYGLLVPALVDALPTLQVGWSAWLGEGRWGFAGLRFLLASLVLLLPTTAMGATLPVLAEAAVEKGAQLAERVGALYAANTFGAVAGALASGFWLIPTYGISTTVRLAAAIDVSVAMAVLALFSAGGRRLLLLARTRAPSVAERLLEFEPSVRILATNRERRRTLIVFALSGATAMCLEVLWSRAVGVVIGASTYAFTLILTTFLVGLASGAAVAGRYVTTWRDPLRVLARVEIAAAAATILAALVIDRLPLWLHDVTRDESLTHTGLYLTHFLLTALVTLPATLFLGAVFPLVLTVVAPDDEARAGAVVGRAYALNTLGSILGSFAGGFFVLPLMGVERGLETAATVAGGLGVYLLLDRLRSSTKEIVAATLIAALALMGPTWDVERWTAGMFRFYLAREVYGSGWSPSTDIVYHQDGVATTVTVGRYPGRDDGLGVVLKVGGKVDASDIGDMPTQVLSGLLPVLLHDDPKDVLVIGYGSGVTPGALLQAPLQSLWVAELEDAIYTASNRHFSHVNHEPHRDPRATLAVDDGRNFLLTRNLSFDIIVSEPSNPWLSGAASLFTQDFFEIAKRRMRPGGVFLQWLQLYELSPQSIHSLVRTFHRAFPHVLVFTPDPHSNDTFLVGADHPLRIQRARLERWWANPKVAAELARARVHEPDDLLGLFFVGEEGLPSVVGPGPINTDDNALIEYAAPRDLLEYGTRDAHVPFRDRARGRRRILLADGGWFEGFSSSPEALASRGYRLFRQGRLADARDHVEAAKAGGADVESLEAILDVINAADDQPVVIANERTRTHRRYAEVVRAMLDGRDRDALLLAETSTDAAWTESAAHAFLRAFLLYREGESSTANTIFDKLLSEDEFVAEHPEVLFYAGRAAATRHRWDRALEILQRYEMARAR